MLKRRPARAGTPSVPSLSVCDHLASPGTWLGHRPLAIVPAPKRVVVGVLCGMAVLRGADVFAPGVKGIESAVEAFLTFFLLFLDLGFIISPVFLSATPPDVVSLVTIACRVADLVLAIQLYVNGVPVSPKSGR